MLAPEARELEEILARDGVHAVLRHLNARTRYRFTGLYLLDGELLRSVSLFDRENPRVRLGGVDPLRETYCAIVAETGAPFAIENAATDPRAACCARRETLLAYCGLPVVAGDGACIGTLCHFDARPRVLPVAELPLLEVAARLLAGELEHVRGDGARAAASARPRRSTPDESARL